MTGRLASKTRRARLRVRRPIAESEVVRFESEFGVAIPEDYRNFLIHVANGGRTPCRLVRLSDWDHCYWIEDPKPHMVAEPCIVTPESEQHGERWIEEAKGPDWEARWENDEWDPMFGTIAIAEYGCGLFFSMIMNGPFRGRIFIWGDHALNPPHVFPEASFGEWFEDCLDQTIEGKPVHFLDGRLS